MKTLYPFQEAGVQALLAGTVLNADDPGCGKTVQAIETCKRTGALNVLIICPAVALAVWRTEIRDQWPECAPHYLRDLPALEGNGPRALITGYEYLLVNDRAKALVAAGAPYDVLVLDEAHALKNPTAKRTMLVYGPGCAGGQGSILSMCGRVILLTGTPMLNHPGELFPHLRALAPERIAPQSYVGFTSHYCTFKTRVVKTRRGSRAVEVIDGANRSTLPDLVKRMRGFWIRRKVEDIGIELPPLRLVTRTLDAAACDASLIAEAEDSDEARALRAAIATGRLDTVQEAQVSRLRRLLGLAKTTAAVDWIRGALDEGEPKVALWGWHTDALHQCAKALRDLGVVLIDGSASRKNRDAAVEAFQNGTAKVFVGQIRAAGTAITLTAARRAVFLEMAWTPALNYQALKRHHRIGSTMPVLGEALCVADSIDEALNEILARKSTDIAMLEGEAA